MSEHEGVEQPDPLASPALPSPPEQQPAEHVADAQPVSPKAEALAPAVEAPAVEAPAVEAPAIETPACESPAEDESEMLALPEAPSEAAAEESAPEPIAAEAAPEEPVVAPKEPVVAPKPAKAAKAPKAPKPPKAPKKPRKTEEPKPAYDGPRSDKMDWYILKVQSNREEAIKEGLRRRVAVAGYEPFFGDIIVPTEKVTEFKAGKRRVYKRKLYPGYLVVQMEINEDTWFLVRETPGIGDFTGAGGHPTPMNPREIAAILSKQEERTDEAPKLKINFVVGDRVKIKEGTFENFEGEVASIDETNGRVTVLINIFGRSTPVDIEYWQIESI